MTDREKILIALREKPLKVFEIMKRVNIKHQDDCQSLLLKMRDDGAVNGRNVSTGFFSIKVAFAKRLLFPQDGSALSKRDPIDGI